MVHAAAAVDPKTRVVITGMGVASVFGNDVTKFYDRFWHTCMYCTVAPADTGMQPVMRTGIA